MNSFISWIGGKKSIRNKILEQFPEKGAYERYVEVFGGAGWVLFAKERHANMEVFNDINGELINLYRCIKYHPEAVQKEIEYSFISREQFYDLRAQNIERGMTDIQRAGRFFIMILNSYGSDLHSFGMRMRDMQKAKGYLKEVSCRLSKVIIENADFEKIIRNYDKPETLFYLDPPYYEAEKYYANKFTEEDHRRLRDVLATIEGKFVLSYNDCNHIKSLYEGCRIIEVERSHNLVQKTRTEKYQELIAQL